MCLQAVPKNSMENQNRPPLLPKEAQSIDPEEPRSESKPTPRSWLSERKSTPHPFSLAKTVQGNTMASLSEGDKEVGTAPRPGLRSIVSGIPYEQPNDLAKDSFLKEENDSK